jgi:predicted DNA-binding protein
MRMLNERLQVLLTSEQRQRLEAEARRRGSSVGSLVRQAIDAHFGSVSREDRLRAVEEIRSMGTGRFLPPEELDEIVESERDRSFPIEDR